MMENTMTFVRVTVPAASRAARALGAALFLFFCFPVAALDLKPIEASRFDANAAAHLASRGGFGATPEEVRALVQLGPRAAVQRLVRGPQQRKEQAPFQRSGVFEPGLDPFPPSRPETTRLAKEQGHALGVSVKPSGNRPLQPVVDKFFYWLRASRLETDRVAYWWANQMLETDHPLQEKMALFWHGHFATNEDKVRDYRKMLKQLELFRAQGLGNFRTLLIGVAQDPAMLVFLDAGVNTKASPNENFAREIMELFTMGVGHYSERDVQEAARAFTGWNVRGLEFVVDAEHHDEGSKTFLGRQGNFDGEEVIDIILREEATSRFIASKLYRYFVNEDLDTTDEPALGALLRDVDYDLSAFLEVLFSSNEFYAPSNVGTRVKGPVELLVSTYRQLGVNEVPGVPDFNVVTGALGQRLMHPPTVAGWSQGRSWITPSLMFERSNFVLDVLFSNVGFIPPDRFPGYTAEIVNVQRRLREGMPVSEATKPTGVDTAEGGMAASNLLADRDEDFNTRLGSMRGWQLALERVEPIPRRTARVRLTETVRQAELATAREVVDFFADAYMSVALHEETLAALTDYLVAELGTDDLETASTYMEEPLRKLLHQLLSLPEYQLG